MASYNVQQYFLVASLAFLYLNYLWAGILRPALVVGVNLFVPRRSHSDWYTPTRTRTPIKCCPGHRTPIKPTNERAG